MALLLRAALVLCLLYSLVVSAVAQSATNYSVLYRTFPLCDLATDGSGALYVLLCDGDVVKLAPNGTQLTAFEAQYKAALASSTAYVRPLHFDSLRVSASGTVWVEDTGNAQLVGVANIGSSTPTVYVVSTVALEDTWEYSIAPNSENLWVVTLGDDSPLQVLSPQGATLQKWNSSSVPGLSDFLPLGILATASSVYVGGCYPLAAFTYVEYDYSGIEYPEIYLNPPLIEGCGVRQFSADGRLLQTFTVVFPSYVSFNFSGLQSLGVDGSGSVYAYDGFWGLVYQWASDGTQLQVDSSSEYYDFASTTSGVVYAATYNDPFAVVTVNPANLSALSSFDISSNTFAQDYSVAISPDGRVLYATSYSGNRILQLNTSTGAVLGYLGVGLLQQSQFITTDTAGNLYVSDSLAAVVYKLSSNGTILLTITGSSPNTSFSSPAGVAVNPTTGEVVVADYGAAQLLVFAADGTFSRSIDTTQFTTPVDTAATDPYYYYEWNSFPFSVAVSSTGVIAFTDVGLRDVVVIPTSGNATSLLSSAVVSPGLFGSPYSLTLSNDGRIFVTNDDGVYVFSMTGQLLGTLLYPSQGLDILGLAYYAPLDILYGADYENDQIVSFSAALPPTLNGSLCALFYSLPGNVDYPWSVAVSLQFSYLPSPVTTAWGRAVQLVSGSGSRVYTNRFGGTLTTAITLSAFGLDQLLYLNSTIPVDSSGISYAVVDGLVQLPGAGALNTYFGLFLQNASGYVAESGNQRIDNQGAAFLSSIPGFRNLTIGASNVNALAVNYGACKAPLTFTNGLRSPTQPSASNGAVRFLYSYTISDGKTYSVTANLTMTASSAFATTTDALGNPYQTLTNITGTRLYTYLPTGGQLLSTVTSIHSGFAGSDGDQRFYPYSLLASAPGVYTVSTAPFLDSVGIGFKFSPPAPLDGFPANSNSTVNFVRVYQATTLTASYLVEVYPGSLPVLPQANLQQQTFTLL